MTLAAAISAPGASAQLDGAESTKRISHPDISGIWLALPEPEGARPPRSGESEDAFDDEVWPRAELTPEYQAKYEANKATYLAATTPEGAGAANKDSLLVRRQAECLPYGMPRMMHGASDSLDIMVADSHILIAAENNGETRRIWLDRPQLPLEEVDLGYFGRSVGHWEGDTLVVNTIGIREDLEGPNYFAHSEQMVITERIRLEDDILVNEVTIADPLALKKPWTFVYRNQRASKEYEQTEWVCDTHRFQVDDRGSVTFK